MNFRELEQFDAELFAATDKELKNDVQLALREACEAGIDALIVQDLGVARLAKKYGRKVVAFAGMLGEGAEECLQSGLIDECYQIERGDMDLETAMVTENAINNLRNTVSNVL